jgi:hypothetical protein
VDRFARSSASRSLFATFAAVFSDTRLTTPQSIFCCFFQFLLENEWGLKIQETEHAGVYSIYDVDNVIDFILPIPVPASPVVDVQLQSARPQWLQVRPQGAEHEGLPGGAGPGVVF